MYFIRPYFPMKIRKNATTFITNNHFVIQQKVCVAWYVKLKSCNNGYAFWAKQSLDVIKKLFNRMLYYIFKLYFQMGLFI